MTDFGKRLENLSFFIALPDYLKRVFKRVTPELYVMNVIKNKPKVLSG